MPLVSIRAYAKHRGVSLHAVQKAIRSRRIQLVDGRIEVEQADLEWARNTRPRREPLSYSAPQTQFVGRTTVLRDGYLARLARLEAEERTRRLVNRSEVEAAMLRFARRVAPVLARESDPLDIEVILENEFRAALRASVTPEEQSAWRCRAEFGECRTSGPSQYSDHLRTEGHD